MTLLVVAVGDGVSIATVTTDWTTLTDDVMSTTDCGVGGIGCCCCSIGCDTECTTTAVAAVCCFVDGRACSEVSMLTAALFAVASASSLSFI